MTAAPRVVFWDFDGTLARRDGLWSGALLDAWRQVDSTSELTVDALRPHLGTGFPWHDPATVRTVLTPNAWWTAMAPVFFTAYTANGLDADRARRAITHIPAEFYRLDAWRVIDGALDALALTGSAGYRNVVLSNHAPELPELVAALGLSEHVEHTITSAEVGAEKPHPAIFTYALDRFSLSRSDDVWMVGDNPIADVEGARSAGIRAILADGAYPDSAGVTVLEAAQQIVQDRGAKRTPNVD